MSAQQILEVARRELGTVESPADSNRTKYGRAYGLDGNAWCAMFVWWCFQQAGDGGLIPKAAYTPAFAQWFRSRGRWGSAPRPGAVVFFDFPGDGVNRISHVGLVEAVNRNGTITTIEGNTSSGSGGSQRDGGGVHRRTRRSGIAGYGYPAYAAGVRILRLTEKPYMRGEDVVVAQRAFGQQHPDGIFGPDTERDAKAFQRAHGLLEDGVVGPATRAKF